MSKPDIFSFSRTQRRGVLLLILLVLVIAGIQWVLKFGNPADLSSQDFNEPSSNKYTVSFPIEINSADTSQFDALPGIGPVLSKRIVAYRKAKGGFRSVSDLASVYGISQETYNKISKLVTLDSSLVLDEKPHRTYSGSSNSPNPTELNSADSTQLSELPGIGPVLSRRIIKYRQMKRGFREVDELKEVYGLKEETFERIKEYLFVDTTLIEIHSPYSAFSNSDTSHTSFRKKDSTYSYSSSSTPKWKKRPPVDINSADTVSLKTVYGIGSKLAHRIVEYRDGLGFYHSTEQLKEIYGMSEENYDRILEGITMDLNDIEELKLKINKVSVEELAKHPYIDFKKARTIVNYREQHGPYRRNADLKKLYGLPQETREKIAPYLSFE